MDVFAVAVHSGCQGHEWLKFCGETADGERGRSP